MLTKLGYSAKLLLRNRRTRLSAVCLILFALVLLSSSSPQTRDRIGSAIHGHDHDVVAWELRNFFDKWLSKTASFFDEELSEENAIAEVREYARLTGEDESHRRGNNPCRDPWRTRVRSGEKSGQRWTGRGWKSSPVSKSL